MACSIGRKIGRRFSRGVNGSASRSRALASQPPLLLLDKPLGALDALTRIAMQQLIEDLWQEQRFTAVVITHDVTEAVALGDRIIVIEAGQVALNLWTSHDRTAGAANRFRVPQAVARR